MSGAWINRFDLNAAKHSSEVFNSMLKRGEIKDADKIVRSILVICRCGAPGCVFISHLRTKID